MKLELDNKISIETKMDLVLSRYIGINKQKMECPCQNVKQVMNSS